MKFIDRYKLSLHNIKNNKSRSILTTIIVYIISLLIMTILCIGISFSNNMTSIIKEYYQSSDEPIQTEYYLYENLGDGKVLNKQVYDALDQKIMLHKSIIDYSIYHNDYNQTYAISDHRFPINYYYEIIEGSNVSSLDTNTNAVLVSTSFANEYYNQTGIKLNPGDEIEYQLEYIIPSSGEYNYITKNMSFKVKGIYKLKEMDVSSYGYYAKPLKDSADLIIDVNYMFNNVKDFYAQSAIYYYTVTRTNFSNEELLDKLDAFVKDISSVLPKPSDRDSVSCSALNDMKMTNVIGIAVIGIASFLCLILILLSIGSLANTIMISVDKNKKFIGLLKALGLNEKDLKSTIKLESITTIVSGIILAFLTIFIFKGSLSNLNTIIINSMFSDYLREIDYVTVFNLPIYVPIIVLLFFVAFTLLFARESMSKIAKTDPMSVISEVA